MKVDNLNFDECAALLFDLTEKTADYWDDRAADEYRKFMKSFEKEMSIIRDGK